MHQVPSRFLIRHAAWTCALALCQATAAATITVTSLADDVFVNSAGVTFADPGLTSPIITSSCTLRMAIAAANLNVAVGGCAAGSPGPDEIQFSGSLSLPGRITLANHASPAVPPSYPPVTGLLGTASALIASESLTITGPGSSQLTIDATAPGTSGYRALLMSDGANATLASFSLSGLRITGGRVVNGSGGCLFSSDHVSLNELVLDNCSSVGGIDNLGFGGAAGFGTTNPSVRPNVSMNNVRVSGSRAERGSNANFPVAGGVHIGSTTRFVNNVNMTGSLFIGNSAEQIGGLFIRNANSVTLTDTSVASNHASGAYTPSAISNGRYGGARIEAITGNVSWTESGIIGNTAHVERAGLSIAGVSGSVTLSDMRIAGNVALNARIGGFEVLTGTLDGAGTCMSTGGPVNMTDITLEANIAPLSLGGFRVHCSGATQLTRLIVKDNTVIGGPAYGPYSAGANLSAFSIFGPNGPVTIDDMLLSQNETGEFSGTGGFAVATVDGVPSLTATRLKVRDNKVSKGESGLTLRARDATRTYTLRDSEFTNNWSVDGVGVLFIETPGIYAIENSTIAHNFAAPGGIVRVNLNASSSPGVQFRLLNSTIARNTANFGEAIHADAFSSPAAPGGPTSANSSVQIRNTILGGRDPMPPVTTVFVQPTVGSFSSQASLLENSGGSGVDFCTGAGMLCNLDARIENATAHAPGVTTTRTMKLRQGSPALDSGNDAFASGLSTDQRGTGFPRIVGTRVDMGAYESVSLPPVPGCNLDMDGDSAVLATKEGLVILRALLGFGAAAAVSGTGITEAQWNAKRLHLNANCGTAFGG